MKKAFNVIKNTIIWLIVALAVFMMVFTVISVTTFNRNDRDLFGYKAYIVNSDSMAATDFKAGDLIFVKEVDASTLLEGDIITYISQNSDSFGEVITHKIRKFTTDASGNPGFVTYGTTTGDDDPTIVTYPYVLGKYYSKLTGVGTFFNFLKTPQGYIVCIFVPFMLLILYQGINCVRLFRQYKMEQNEKMEQERLQLEQERERIRQERDEAAKIMQELKVLKEQLGNSEQANTASAAQDTPSEQE